MTFCIIQIKVRDLQAHGWSVSAWRRGAARNGTHCEFRLRNGRGKTCLWKKYILVYLHRQKQGKKNFWLPTLSFWATSQTAPASQPIGLDFMVHVSPALKRTMYEFKNFSSPAFNCQSRPKYIFSRDMFCLYHFWAWIHGVTSRTTKLEWLAPYCSCYFCSLFSFLTKAGGILRHSSPFCAFIATSTLPNITSVPSSYYYCIVTTLKEFLGLIDPNAAKPRAGFQSLC